MSLIFFNSVLVLSIRSLVARMSMTAAAFLVGLAALVAGGIALFKVWFTWRQKRLITCPENEQPAAVRVSALGAAAEPG